MCLQVVKLTEQPSDDEESTMIIYDEQKMPITLHYSRNGGSTILFRSQDLHESGVHKGRVMLHKVVFFFREDASGKSNTTTKNFSSFGDDLSTPVRKVHEQLFKGRLGYGKRDFFQSLPTARTRLGATAILGHQEDSTHGTYHGEGSK